jgi:hypothetical protein
MDPFIYALVLSPALTELLPKSGMANTHENVGLTPRSWRSALVARKRWQYISRECASSFILIVGWVFYLVHGLRLFIACLFSLGFFGGNFALFSRMKCRNYHARVP